jgi:hypothetical protein
VEKPAGGDGPEDRADPGRRFEHRRLKTGATVQMTVTAPGYAGKVMRVRCK